MTRTRPYNAGPTPKLIRNPSAVWAKPSGEPGIIAGAMLLAAVFAIITIWSAVA